MICGVITTKDVLRHSAVIVREFGAVAYFRCFVAVITRRQTTFLDCVCRMEKVEPTPLSPLERN